MLSTPNAQHAAKHALAALVSALPLALTCAGAASAKSSVILRDSSTGTVQALSNEGFGAMSNPFGSQLYAFGAPSVWVPLPGDFDGDGDTDIMVRNSDNGQAAIAVNDGIGRYSWDNTYVNGTINIGFGTVWQPFVGNFAGGPADDLLLRKSGTGEVIVLANTGNNTFSWDQQIRLNAFGAPSQWLPVIGDFDNDGDSDLMIRDHDTGQAAIAFNSGSASGVLSWNGQYVSGTQNIGFGSVWKVFAADLVGNGADDLLLRRDGTGEVIVLANGGSGSFSWDNRIQLNAFGAPSQWEPVLGDFDGDRDADLLIRDRNTGQAAVAKNDAGTFSWNGSYVTGMTGVGANPSWKPFAGVQRIFDTTWDYGGTDRAVNTDAEADAVIAKLRSQSDADAPTTWNGLTPTDQGFVRNRANATIPSSVTYGGSNWKVDAQTDADNFLGAFLDLPSTAARALALSGLASGDRQAVDQAAERALLGVNDSTSESTSSLIVAVPKDTWSDVLIDPTDAAASSASNNRGCRDDFRSAISLRVPKSGTTEKLFVGKSFSQVIFCWNRSKWRAARKAGAQSVSWRGQWFDFPDGFEQLGWRTDYGEMSGVEPASWQTYTRPQTYRNSNGSPADASVPSSGAWATDARFEQRFYLRKCDDETVRLILKAKDLAEVGFERVNSGCPKKIKAFHVVRGLFTGGSETALHWEVNAVS